jgi:SAM-dependent methyltransferase
MDLVEAALGRAAKFGRALDIGCGAGLSTRALDRIAVRSVGIEPAVCMLQWHSEIAPGADFAAARAEALPFQAASFDLMAAAGSLNYVDLELFFAEARRVLMRGGMLVVYDFSPGSSFRDSNRLDDWFSAFVARYPWPPGEANEVSPEILTQLNCGFRLHSARRFVIPLELSFDFYVEYMMTETNVAWAIRNGAPEHEIRSWCTQTLRPVFGLDAHDVLFRGYFACLMPG